MSDPGLDVVTGLPLAADLEDRLDALTLFYGWQRRYEGNHPFAEGLVLVEEAELKRLLDLDPPTLRLPGASQLFAVHRSPQPAPPDAERSGVVVSLPSGVDWALTGARDARAGGVALLSVHVPARPPAVANPDPVDDRSTGETSGGLASRRPRAGWTPPPRTDSLSLTVRGTTVNLQRFEAHLTRVTWPLRSATGSDAAWVAVMAPWSPRTALELLLRHDVLPVNP